MDKSFHLTIEFLKKQGVSDENIRYIGKKMYMSGHPARKTSESVEIQPLEGDCLLQQKDWLINCMIQELPITRSTTTVSGNTQESGKQLEDLIEKYFIEKRIPYKRAGTQQPIDFRWVYVSEGTGYIFLEIKKTSSYIVKLNDSIPKPGTWYVIHSVTYGKIILILADILLKNNNELSEYKRMNECLRHDYKKISDFGSAARMNLSINIRRYIESDQDVFWDINADIP
jgi:hypothetical protein